MITAGITRVRFTVTITDDDVQEIDETFRLSIFVTIYQMTSLLVIELPW